MIWQTRSRRQSSSTKRLEAARFYRGARTELYLDAVAKNYQIDVEQLRKVVNKLGSQIVVGLGEPREYHTDANR